MKLLKQVILCRNRFNIHHREVAAIGEIAFLVEHIGHPAGHASGKVAPCLTKNHNHPASHIFAAVIAHAFHNRHGTRVAHGEAFACHAATIELARDGTIEHSIAHDDGGVWVNARFPPWPHDDAPAGKPLAHIVVGLTRQLKSNAMCQEGPKSLTRCAAEGDANG